MIFFYCQSYQAFNLALSTGQSEEVTIITSSEKIIEACNFLKINYIEHKEFGVVEILKNRKPFDAEVDSITNKIGNNELHFSHTQFAFFCFCLVKKIIDRKGKVIFHDFEFVYDKPKFSAVLNKNSYKVRLNSLILRLLLKLPVEIRSSSKNEFLVAIKQKYVNITCQKVYYENDLYFQTTLNLFKNISFTFEPIQTLFIAQTFSNNNLFDEKKIIELLPILNTENYTVKMHPRLGDILSLSKMKRLPDFLPVEFFFKKVTGTVLSFHSASLVTASKFENIRVISLIDLVTHDDPYNVRVKEDLIRKSGNKILFPQTINELKQFLYG